MRTALLAAAVLALASAACSPSIQGVDGSIASNVQVTLDVDWSTICKKGDTYTSFTSFDLSEPVSRARKAVLLVVPV